MPYALVCQKAHCGRPNQILSESQQTQYGLSLHYLGCKEELKYLQTWLLKDPILAPLDPNKDIIVQTDASKEGMAWICFQKSDDGVLKVVHYGRVAITNAQKNYPASELELIALVLALKYVHWFAVLRNVTVVTDNSRVVYLNN